MNRADVAMLVDSLNNFGEGAMKRKQTQFQNEQAMQRLALEQQVKDIQESRYNAQQTHYNEIEKSNSRRADAADTRAQAQSDAEGLKEKADLFKSAAGLNATGALTDESRDQFNKWLSSDTHFGATGLQLKAVDPKFQKTAGKETAVVQAIKTAESYRKQADDTDDPEQKKQYLGYADLLEKAAKKQGEFAPPKAGMNKNTQLQYDPLTGKLIGKSETDAPILPPEPSTPAASNSPTATPNVPPPSASLVPLSGAGMFSPIQQSKPQITPEDVNSLLGSPSAPTAVTPAASPATPMATPVNPPPSHVAYLKANANDPKVIADFEQKYGQGSAAQYLQGP